LPELVRHLAADAYPHGFFLSRPMQRNCTRQGSWLIFSRIETGPLIP
jgi:hypothetical protein